MDIKGNVLEIVDIDRTPAGDAAMVKVDVEAVIAQLALGIVELQVELLDVHVAVLALVDAGAEFELGRAQCLGQLLSGSGGVGFCDSCFRLFAFSVNAKKYMKSAKRVPITAM